jgi:hypothetical protein
MYDYLRWVLSPSFALTIVARAWGLGEAWDDEDDLKEVNAHDHSEAA